MKTADCNVCEAGPDLERKGDWVKFRDYKPEQVNWIGHPEGLEFFCAEHIDAARELVHLDSDEAIEVLKVKYPMAQVKTPVSPPARGALATFFMRMRQKLR